MFEASNYRMQVRVLLYIDLSVDECVLMKNEIT